MIENPITRAHSAGTKVGLCGQAPWNDPAFAKLLLKAGCDSILVPSFIAIK